MNEENVIELVPEPVEGEAAAEESGGSSGGSTTIVYDVHLWDEHPMMSTSFSDYSVAEGLLLLIFVILLLNFFMNLLRRWF